MNERIRLLAIQADATIDKGTHPLTGVVDGLFMGPNEVEKFAELIIRECADVAMQADIDGCNIGNRAWQKINEHFEVEE